MQIQYVGHERKAKCPTFFMPNFFWNTLDRSAFYHFGRRFGVFVGHTWGIRGVFTEYTYVSGMCRVCIGYVSGKCRRGRGARGGDGCRMQIDESIFFCKYCSLYLRMCIFFTTSRAPTSKLQLKNADHTPVRSQYLQKTVSTFCIQYPSPHFQASLSGVMEIVCR